MADELHVIEGDSPVKGDLMFWSIVGHEGFSRPSAYELTVLSKKKSIEAKDILGYSFDVKISFFDEGKAKHSRHFQGHAVRLLCLRQVGRYFEYRISLRSWFWLLTKRHNSRIHQDKKVLEVFDATVNDSPISKLNKVKKGHVSEPHSVRHYCVQFQETDYQFLSRLLEEEGIYYWFDSHDAPGTMHLSDSSVSAHDPLPVKATMEYRSADRIGDARFNEINEWIAGRRFESGKYASQDSQYVTIKKKLAVVNAVPDDHELADLEVFEFPGNYLKNEDIDIPDSDVENTAKVRGKEIGGRRDRHWALTQWPDVAPGKSFKYKGDPDGSRNGDYIIAGCTLAISHPGYEGIGDVQAAKSLRAALQAAMANDNFNAGTEDVLTDLVDSTEGLSSGARGVRSFLISCLPKEISYKPGRVTPRVVMPGPQSAIVVGPKGEELHVDKHGRVKVHFHWDRYDKSDENSTCWVRVSQPWAGKKWGGYFAPRIGQEVIVDFVNGDPDRPIIMGRVYNDDQPIPYESPTQSGFKSRSTPGGGSSNYNEIMFEDKKGHENINIHAELDMSRSVERDDSTTVDRDQSVTVKRDQTNHVDRDRKSTVTRNDTNMVVVDQKNTVKGKQNNQVVGKRDTYIDSDDLLKVGGTQTTDVTGAYKGTFRGGETRNVVGNQTVKVTGNLTYMAAKMSFEAAHIDWNVTGSSSKYITVPNGPLALMANKIKLVSNTGVETMAVGSVDTTAIGSNTTILGTNTSGYIGSNSEANLGMTRCTFMGLSLENALGLSSSFFGGLQIENTLALRIIGAAAAEMEACPASVEAHALKTFTPGAGPGGVATGAAVAAGVAAFVAGATGAYDTLTTLKQYADAAKALDEAAKEADQQNLPGLAGRLRQLSNKVRDVRIAGAIEAVPVIGTAAAIVAQPIVSALGGVEGTIAGDPPTNADGSPSPPGGTT